MKTEQKEAPITSYAIEERSLAYQLRHSLLRIAQAAQSGDIEGVDTTATSTLQLIDCYLLGTQSPNQLALRLESVSLGALLQDAIHQLLPLARQNDCQLQFVQKGIAGLVVTDARLTKAAFLALGQTYIENILQLSHEQQPPIIFGVKAKAAVHTAGIFSPGVTIPAKSLRQSRKIAGNAAQPCASLAGSSAGLVLADLLLRRMDNKLAVGRFMQTAGLSARFLPSRQLQLV